MIGRLSPVPFRFWRSASGHEPVREWLGLLSIEDKKRIGHDIAVVQFGWPISMPICRPLGDGLWEIRSTLPSGREARILFGFAQEQIIAVHSFFKKTQSTQKRELDVARTRLKGLNR